ncbi:hypothetical protein TRIUR3_27599 [Triticum urartu]|uniref:Uncharacterized protein n=1 Tax=Triticum urartu TaxID=4572 RepID=M7ZUU9_TRIUA|nr:hypothetical protein TRIUR3_27599 [Triticum urartu]
MDFHQYPTTTTALASWVFSFSFSAWVLVSRLPIQSAETARHLETGEEHEAVDFFFFEKQRLWVLTQRLHALLPMDLRQGEGPAPGSFC